MRLKQSKSTKISSKICSILNCHKFKMKTNLNKMIFSDCLYKVNFSMHMLS